MTGQMKEAMIGRGTQVQVIDSPLPKPGLDEIRVRVVVSGSNPKDWKVPEYYISTPFNSGDDIAGIVDEVGSNVSEFAVGDRVASLHKAGTPGGGFAEYAIGQASTTFLLSPQTSFEEAATVPLAALTAAVLLYRGLGLPEPWTSPDDRARTEPFMVYGGSSAVGAFSIQLARRSGLGPIVAVAGNGSAFVASLLDASAGDAVADYRDGDETVKADIIKALQGRKIRYALDAVIVYNSTSILLDIMKDHMPDDGQSRLALALPLAEDTGAAAGRESVFMKPLQIPPGISTPFLGVNLVHQHASPADADFGFVFSRYIGHGLRQKWFRPHPHKVQPGGLLGLQEGLQELRDGRASAVKFVYRIADTFAA